MLLRESGPTSLNRNKKLHFSFPPAPKGEAPVSLSVPNHEAHRQVYLAVRRGRLRRRRGDYGAGTTENLSKADTRRCSSW